MTEEQWLTLIWKSKIWISQDQKTKIKFSSFPVPDLNRKLTYSINYSEEKNIPVHISTQDNDPLKIKDYHIIGILFFADNTIRVSLPEIDIQNLHQIDDPDETD